MRPYSAFNTFLWFDGAWSLAILTSEVNGVKNSPGMVKSVVAAAERAGVPFKVKSYPLGGDGSDAGSFSRAGLKAATLLPFKVPQ